jgi:Rrf2 family protein
MKLSTRTRYGVRLMVELGLNYGKKPIFLKDIARRENISEKYLSIIVIRLRGAGLVASVRGVNGGYNLAKDPVQITLIEVVTVLEGNCHLVHCVKNSSACSRAPQCASRDVWILMCDSITETLSSITLDWLIKKQRQKSGVKAKKK